MGELVKQDLVKYLAIVKNINSSGIDPVIVFSQVVCILQQSVRRHFNSDDDSNKKFDDLKKLVGKKLQKLSQRKDPVDELDWLQSVQRMFKDMDATHKDSMDDQLACMDILDCTRNRNMKREFPSKGKIEKKIKLNDHPKGDSAYLSELTSVSLL